MTDPDPGPVRRYDEAEIARILERATELQRHPRSRPGGHGLTLSELEEVAVEAGIDPAVVRRAALELDSRTAPAGPWTRVLGGATAIVLERTLRGEIGAEDFGLLVEVMQRGAGTHGQPGIVGRTLTWTTDTPTRSRSLQITVASRRGETHIHIEERLQQLAGQLFGGVMAGVGGGVGFGLGVPLGIVLFGSPLMAVALPAGVIGLSYATARGIFGSASRRRARELAELMERLTEAVQRLQHDLLEAPERPPQPPRLR
jgi:ribosomal protein L13E